MALDASRDLAGDSSWSSLLVPHLKMFSAGSGPMVRVTTLMHYVPSGAPGHGTALLNCSS